MRTVYPLKPKEIAEVEKAIKQDKRPDVRQRTTVIRLLHMGHKPGIVAEQQMVSVPTIYNWHKLWREQGVEGLANKQKTGRKPKATAELVIQARLDGLYGQRWKCETMHSVIKRKFGTLFA